jgi:hypothetical protein
MTINEETGHTLGKEVNKVADVGQKPYINWLGL